MVLLPQACLFGVALVHKGGEHRPLHLPGRVHLAWPGDAFDPYIPYKPFLLGVDAFNHGTKD